MKRRCIPVLLLACILPLSNGCALVAIGMITAATATCIKNHNAKKVVRAAQAAKRQREIFAKKTKPQKCLPIKVEEIKPKKCPPIKIKEIKTGKKNEQKTK